MNKHDRTPERTQFFFQNQFFKSFLLQITTAGLNTPRCDLNGLLIHKIYSKGKKKSTADGRHDKRCHDVSMQSGTLLMKKSWTKNERKVLIARFAERAAILVSNVPSLSWI